jgi:hypothetical protein
VLRNDDATLEPERLAKGLLPKLYSFRIANWSEAVVENNLL